MCDEGAAMLVIGLPEPGDGGLGTVDCGKHVRLVEPDVKRVVRPLPRLLQGDERIGKTLYFERKPLHRLSVSASAICASVLHGAVHLMPGLATASADEQVGRGAGQAVEHGVVRSADGTAEVRLRRPPQVALRQAAGRGYQVARVQGASRPGTEMGRLYSRPLAYRKLRAAPSRDTPFPEGSRTNLARSQRRWRIKGSGLVRRGKGLRPERSWVGESMPAAIPVSSARHPCPWPESRRDCASPFPRPVPATRRPCGGSGRRRG